MSLTYINCSAAVKALSDIIVTSSNAEKIVRSIPPEQEILFAPDRHLGAFLSKKTGSADDALAGHLHRARAVLRARNREVEGPVPRTRSSPRIPECPEAILRHADHVGSTRSILNYVTTAPGKTIPDRDGGRDHPPDEEARARPQVHPRAARQRLPCNECPFMKLNTLEKLYLCLRDERPEIVLPEELRRAAEKPLLRMLELS